VFLVIFTQLIVCSKWNLRFYYEICEQHLNQSGYKTTHLCDQSVYNKEQNSSKVKSKIIIIIIGYYCMYCYW